MSRRSFDRRRGEALLGVAEELKQASVQGISFVVVELASQCGEPWYQVIQFPRTLFGKQPRVPVPCALGDGGLFRDKSCDTAKHVRVGVLRQASLQCAHAADHARSIQVVWSGAARQCLGDVRVELRGVPVPYAHFRLAEANQFRNAPGRGGLNHGRGGGRTRRRRNRKHRGTPLRKGWAGIRRHATLASVLSPFSRLTQMQDGHRQLYPEITPYDEGYLQVSPLHTVYYEQ